jgi:hypothetical protein
MGWYRFENRKGVVGETRKTEEKSEKTPEGFAQISEATVERQRLPELGHRDIEDDRKFS